MIRIALNVLLLDPCPPLLLHTSLPLACLVKLSMSSKACQDRLLLHMPLFIEVFDVITPAHSSLIDFFAQAAHLINAFLFLQPENVWADPAINIPATYLIS